MYGDLDNRDIILIFDLNKTIDIMITKKRFEKLQEKVLELGFEFQRMSSSGKEEYNEICDLVNVEKYIE